MKNRNSIGTKIWNAQVAQFRNFAKKHKGFLPEVLKMAKQMHPEIEWTRAHVHYWLNPTKGKAGEPNYGNGTILLRVCQAATISMELAKAGAQCSTQTSNGTC